MFLLLAGLSLLAMSPVLAAPMPEQVDQEVRRAMAAANAKGLALAVIEDGRVVYVQAYGQRNQRGEALRPDTVMYGASLTKTVFAYTVMQLVDAGLLELDASIERYLPRALPDMPFERRYARWSDLAGDPRWRSLTPRILLSHRSGFANFAFAEPDGKLRFHFEPGARYAYSGEGYILLQFVLEQGLGLSVGDEIRRRVVEPSGLTRTSMTWRPDFVANVADGFDASGAQVKHDERSNVRAAGSLDTTIEDFAQFAAYLVRGDGLSKAARAEITRSQGPITTASQFPTLAAELPADQRRSNLGAGLGVVTFVGPQGPGFFKGGHDDTTGNMLVCVERARNCVVLLANDVRAEAVFPRIVGFILGDTGVPWDWEYGPRPNSPGGE